MKQKYFTKKVLNQKEIDEFWKGLMSGNREKDVLPMAADKESTKKFVNRINAWILRNQNNVARHENITVHSFQYSEDLSECVVVYE